MSAETVQPATEIRAGATTEQWALVLGLAASAVFLPGVLRAAMLVLAGVVAAAVRCPRAVSIFLFAAGVPLLLFGAVTRGLWFG